MKIDIILSPEQARSFHNAIVEHGYGVIDVPLAGIDSAAAQASVEADLTAIRLAIQSFSGGFETLDEVVRQQLRQWFESQGGIKVAGSFARGNSTSSANSKTATIRAEYIFSTQYAARRQEYKDYSARFSSLVVYPSISFLVGKSPHTSKH